MKRQPFANPEVQAAYAGYRKEIRKPLLALRDLVFRTSAASPEVGEIEETLKWSEPSYLTSRPKSGTTLRLAPYANDRYGMFVHCQTSLVSDFKELYPELDYDGKRGILFGAGELPPAGVAEHFIEAALTYHSARRRAARQA